MFKRLVMLLGFITSGKKGQQPTTALLLLGALVAIGASSFTADATPERVDKIRGYIFQALSADALTPAAASKLRGGRGFYTPLLAGKLGRGMMGPLIARQYWQMYHALDGELRRNLLLRYTALGSTFAG